MTSSEMRRNFPTVCKLFDAIMIHNVCILEGMDDNESAYFANYAVWGF